MPTIWANVGPKERLEKIIEDKSPANDGFLNMRLPQSLKDELVKAAEFHGTTTSAMTRAYGEEIHTGHYSLAARDDKPAHRLVTTADFRYN
jgi:hypothetical protein